LSTNLPLPCVSNFLTSQNRNHEKKASLPRPCVFNFLFLTSQNRKHEKGSQHVRPDGCWAKALPDVMPMPAAVMLWGFTFLLGGVVVAPEAPS
jgi:hypothetical protein